MKRPLPFENTSEKVLETRLVMGVGGFALAILPMSEEGKTRLAFPSGIAPTLSLLDEDVVFERVSRACD